MEWEKVREEMVEKKGLSSASADKIGGYVQISGMRMFSYTHS